MLAWMVSHLAALTLSIIWQHRSTVICCYSLLYSV